MFAITGGKGFHMTFANGWTVSVQFGIHNYCDHNNTIVEYVSDFYAGPSKTAEVAIWHGDLVVGGIEPLGWQTPEQVAAIITEVANRPTTEG